MKSVVFHYVGLLWMIETKENFTFSVNEYYVEWCTRGPWFRKNKCQNLHGPIFEELFVTTRQDRYSLMRGLHAYNK